MSYIDKVPDPSLSMPQLPYCPLSMIIAKTTLTHRSYDPLKVTKKMVFDVMNVCGVVVLFV